MIYFNTKLTTALMVVLLSLLVITVFFFVYDANHLHFMPGFINDQVHHIGLARHLVDYGRVVEPGRLPGTGNIIYIGALKYNGLRFYTPGYYSWLALSFLLFGVTPFTAILPSMFCYVVTVGLVFFVTQKLYDQRSAIAAAVIFMFIPMTIFYSFVAMTEMSHACVAMLSFVLLMLIPTKYRAWFIPFLLIIPYLFRQTSLFLIFPMVAYAVDSYSMRTKKQVFVVILASLFVLRYVNAWQVKQGLLALPFLDFLTRGHIDYNDIHNVAGVHATFFQLLSMLYEHTINNFKLLFSTLRHENILPKLTVPMFYTSVLMTLLSFYYGVLKRKRKIFPLAVSLMVITMVGMLMVLYHANFNKITRHCIYTTPFLAVVCGGFLFDKNLGANRLCQFLQRYKYILIASLVLVSLIGNIHAAKHVRREAIVSQRYLHFIESIKPDYQHVVAAPCYTTTEFIFKHYPTIVSFMPNNDESLIELNKRFSVGTLVINENDSQYQLTKTGIKKIGLHLSEVREFSGDRWFIYKRKTS